MILVLGGTGFVGAHLLASLVNRPERVRCAVRTELEYKRLADLGIEPVWADVRDYNSLVNAMDGARAVIDLVTVIRERQQGDFAAILYGGVRNMIEAARAVGLSSIIHVGALGESFAREDPKLKYLYWKQRGTELLAAQDLDFTIFETSIVFGPGDQHLTAIALTLKWLPIVPIPGIAIAEIQFQPICVGDLVTCLVKALDDPKSIRRRFPLGGPQVFSYREMVALVAKVLEVQARILFVPRWSVRLVLAVFNSYLRYPPITTALLDLGNVNSIAESSATYRHFGIAPLRLKDATGYLRQVGREQFLAWTHGSPSHGIFDPQDRQTHYTP